MQVQHVFEICFDYYRAINLWLNGRGGKVVAVDLSRSAGGYRWRPERARAQDYVTDFEYIARRTLQRPSWKGRKRVLEVYFIRGIEYRRAITLLGVSPNTFDYWVQEVKKSVGRELTRAGLFPPRRYFAQL